MQGYVRKAQGEYTSKVLAQHASQNSFILLRRSNSPPWLAAANEGVPGQDVLAAYAKGGILDLLLFRISVYIADIMPRGKHIDRPGFLRES